MLNSRLLHYNTSLHNIKCCFKLTGLCELWGADYK